MDPTPEEVYARYGSGVLVRETAGYLDPFAAEADRTRVRLRPYGWLRGALIVLDSPLPNMDASAPYHFTAALLDFNGRPVARSFRVQQICEALDGVDPFMGSFGEVPLL